MKYRWLYHDKTCEELSKELGCEVKSITKGTIFLDKDTYCQGIEIEVEKELAPDQLTKLDALFPEHHRESK